MGYTSWAEKKAQQGLCARAADAAWLANCGVGMVTAIPPSRAGRSPAYHL